ncbi:MAG TPA: hypothetical protein VG184_05105 [Acidimicrobiales bacterium]|jgi:hypothetical protein|nr:hypothetical protein [Acidimicrobiales bacterium]
MVVVIFAVALLGPLAFAMILLGLTGCCERWLDKDERSAVVRPAVKAGVRGPEPLGPVDDLEAAPDAVPAI